MLPITTPPYTKNLHKFIEALPLFSIFINTVIFKTLILASLVFPLASCSRIPEEIQAKDLKPGDFIVDGERRFCVTLAIKGGTSDNPWMNVFGIGDRTNQQGQPRIWVYPLSQYPLEKRLKTYQPSQEFKEIARKALEERAKSRGQPHEPRPPTYIKPPSP